MLTTNVFRTALPGLALMVAAGAAQAQAAQDCQDATLVPELYRRAFEVIQISRQKGVACLARLGGVGARRSQIEAACPPLEQVSSCARRYEAKSDGVAAVNASKLLERHPV